MIDYSDNKAREHFKKAKDHYIADECCEALREINLSLDIHPNDDGKLVFRKEIERKCQGRSNCYIDSKNKPVNRSIKRSILIIHLLKWIFIIICIIILIEFANDFNMPIVLTLMFFLIFCAVYFILSSGRFQLNVNNIYNVGSKLIICSIITITLQYIKSWHILSEDMSDNIWDIAQFFVSIFLPSMIRNK